MTWFLVALVVLGTVFGDLLKAAGMRRLGEMEDFSAGGLGATVSRAARSPLLWLSLVGYTVSFFGFMALVSIADVSFAVPATAAGIVVETLLARLLLGETISPRRWAGAALVAAGVLLVGE
ncbi:MAG: EamA family transporter [Acidobacteria bacterium]|nr:EamA family transporter [Acidobacteriota bacterium]